MSEKRAAIYLRISKAGQSEHSLDVQRKRCVAMAEAKGWAVVAEYVDNGRSGLTMNRPGIDELLQAVKAGGVDAVITLDVSRFGRTSAGITQAVRLLRDHDCEFVSVNDGLDSSTISGRMVITILAAVAQGDSEQKGERITGGLAERREVSPHVTGRPPFGYVKDKGAHGVVHVDPHAAEAVRRVFGLRDEGLTLRAIAERLNADGTPTPTGRGAWHPSSVRNVLAREDRYRGADGWPVILDD